MGGESAGDACDRTVADIWRCAVVGINRSVSLKAATTLRSDCARGVVDVYETDVALGLWESYVSFELGPAKVTQGALSLGFLGLARRRPTGPGGYL